MRFKFFIIQSFLTLLVFFLILPSLSTDYPPADHYGADLILQDGDRIWGKHYNINKFEVPSTTTIQVADYYPNSPNSGFIEIYADVIIPFSICNYTNKNICRAFAIVQ